MKRPTILITLGFLILSCSEEKLDELIVVASFLPVYLITENVVDNTEGVIVEMLLGSGDIHNYQLAPGDMLKLNNADLVIINGLGLESFLEDTLADLGGETEIVAASEGIEPLPYKFRSIHGEGGHGDWDPHVWVSPHTAVRMVENIRDALVEIDPVNAEAYRANARSFIGELEEIYRRMVEASAGWSNKTIITNHDAFGYLARDVGLEIAGVVMLTAGASPSAKEMLGLVEMIREAEAVALFIEPQYPEGPARSIAEEAGIGVYVLDPCTTGSTDAGYLLEVMERNLVNLEAALGG
ncbi:zinc ABC transporter substrate-binding protein [bacterium]|nr:zinc ABC transporter substrate-binding protein [bacterium]